MRSYYKSSKIEEIHVPILDYKRQEHNESCPYFVGRKKELKHLKDLLTTGGEGGAYLLVGSRGMGKTTLVNQTVNQLKKDSREREFEKIEISLSNENFEEIDIFRIIGKKLLNSYLDEPHPLKKWKRILVRLLPLLIVAVGCYFGAEELFKFAFSDFRFEKWLGFITYSLAVVGFIGALLEALFELKTYKHRRKAKRLLTRIDAEVTQQSSLSGTVDLIGKLKSAKLGFGSTTTEKYPIADIRFIEHELIEFLKDINKHNKTLFDTKGKIPKQYIFVFDELDKIEPTSLSETLEQQLTEEIEELPSRKKQQAVFDILGNFKYFLKNAPAKFIFIAGREMTDASMADISKRNFYLRSIFDEIIHVDSLLKGGDSPIDLRITNLVEQYVMKVLKTSNSKFHDQTVGEGSTDKKAFSDDLAEVLPKIDSKYQGKPEENPALAKTIGFLKDFVLYITYRSHGAPKLLVQYFEKYISGSNGGYALKFTYDQQLVIGFLSSLYRPFIEKKYNATIGSSDKLLTTLPFLFDHVLKYHNFAFSWRSLELLPEVIDVNKSPNLRTHIENIVDHFKSSYASEIANGLFEYKFNKAMASEIQWIGDISKTSRAAFNFTLDESLPLKRTYKKRIRRLEKLSRESGYPISKNYIHSLGFYYSILGDLHFYDKEYDLALEHYNQAIQSFRNRNVNTNKQKNIRSHEFIIYVRGMLKLILTYERMKDYSLIFTYIERVNRNVYDFFHFTRRKRKKLKEDREIEEVEDFMRSAEVQFNNQWVFVDGFINLLYITEKSSPQGVTHRDIEFCTTRFFKIVQDNHIAWYFTLLKAHFLNQVGDLLFFKNGLIPMSPLKNKNHKEIQAFFPKSVASHLVETFNIESPEDGYFPKYYNIPVSALEYYKRCLHEFLTNWDRGYNNRYRRIDGGNNLVRVKIDALLIKYYYHFIETHEGFYSHNYQSKLFYHVAGYLADYANATLCTSQASHLRGERVFLVKKLSKECVEEFPSLIQSGYGDPLSVFFFFTCLSAHYYKKINKQTEYGYTLLKIIYAIKYAILLGKRSISKSELSAIYSNLFRPAYRALGGDDLPQIDHQNLPDILKKVLIHEREYRAEKVRELTIVFFEIVLKSTIPDYRELILSDHWIDSNNQVKNSWIRTLELRLKVEINQIRLHEITKKKKAVKLRKNKSDRKKDLSKDANRIIADSIWCLRKIRTSLDVHGINYVSNYYFRSEAHYRIAQLLDEYQIRAENLKNYLKSILYSDKYEISISNEKMDRFFDSSLHCKKAREGYLSTIQLHSQGTCYYDTIRRMYYLEGDFDDQTSHFCAALDRFRINTGHVGNRINECDKKIETS